MSIFKRIFREKADQVKKEVDQAEETLQKAQAKIDALKRVCQVDLLREALGELLTQLKKDCHEHWDHSRWSCDSNENGRLAKKIKDTEKEIGQCVDEMVKAKPYCRNCS